MEIISKLYWNYRKTVVLMFLIKNYVDLLKEYKFLKKDVNCLGLVFKNNMEQYEDHLDYNKDEEESTIDKTSRR